jgi:prephenate dehydrogenase
MKLKIVGDGAFGSFLKELLAHRFELTEDADNVILAVPSGAYDEVARANANKHLINVCSIQKPTTEACLKHSQRVTSLHPLFGSRTPTQYRNAIVTWVGEDNDTWATFPEQQEFLDTFAFTTGSSLYYVDDQGKNFTPESHDRLMEKTHVKAVIAARQIQVLTDLTKNIPDHLVPHSFRLMRNFVATLEDMPKGTMDSILANPYL